MSQVAPIQTEAADAQVIPLSPELAALEQRLSSGTATPEPVAEKKNLREAIAAGEYGVWELGDNLKAFYSPPHLNRKHGFYRSTATTDENGNVNWTDVQVTDWLAYRSAVHMVASADRSGRLKVNEEETTYEVTIIRKDGKTFARSGFSPVDSVNPDKFVDLLDAGVSSPYGGQDVGRLKNCLRTLGHGDGGMERRTFVQHTGWHYAADGTPVFGAPNGSITPDGPTNLVTVVSPPGSEEGAMSDTDSLIGWQEVAHTEEELREAAGSITALLGISPTKQSIGHTFVGGLGGAPLRLRRRATIVMDAVPGSGKSAAMSCVHQFIAPTGVDGSSFTALMPQSSDKGIVATASWSRDLPFTADDFREGSTQADTRRALGALSALVQASYGQSGGRKATARRGMAASQSADVFAFITAEKTPKEATAILQRSVILPIGKDDFDITNHPNPIDKFRKNYGQAGANLANKFYGTYLMWLARKARDYGKDGIAQLSANAEMDRNSLSSEFESGRAGETMAAVATGWKWLLEFANDMGIADLFPTWDEVLAVLRKQVSVLANVHNDAKPGLLTLRAWVQMVEAGELTVLSATGMSYPRGVPNLTTLGWRYDAMAQVPGWRQAGKLGGYYSGDGKHIIITNDALRKAAFRAGFEARTADELTRDLEPYVVEGTTPRGKQGGYTNSRVNGSVLLAKDLGMPEVTPAVKLAKPEDGKVFEDPEDDRPLAGGITPDFF